MSDVKVKDGEEGRGDRRSGPDALLDGSDMTIWMLIAENRML